MLHKRDPERRVTRFYSLMIERDLFGTVRLVRNWGRIGTKGQEMVEIQPTRSRPGRPWRPSHGPSGGAGAKLCEVSPCHDKKRAPVAARGALTAHMDDRVVRHIKDMIRRVIRTTPQNQEQPPLHQAVQAPKRGSDYPDDLMRLARSLWLDDGSKT